MSIEVTETVLDVVVVEQPTTVVPNVPITAIVTETPQVEVLEGGFTGPAGPAGPAGPQNLYVQDADPGMIDPGLWIQTNVAGPGTFSFWIEDGV